MDGNNSGFSLSNLKGTAGMVLLLVAAAMLGLIGFTAAFKGHVQL